VYTERSCTSGLYSGSELRPMLRRVKHVGVAGEIRSADLLGRCWAIWRVCNEQSCDAL